MEGFTFLDNIEVAGIIIAVIVAIIQFIKKLLEQTNWGWVRRLPGEAWFGISIGLGIAASFLFNYNAIQEAVGNALVVPDVLAKVATGIGMGLSSKAVHAVATPIGAKLKEVKEAATVNTEVLQSGPVCPTPEIAPVSVEQPFAESMNPEVILLKTTESNPDYVIVGDKVYKRPKGN
jgi:hypothetical protein